MHSSLVKAGESIGGVNTGHSTLFFCQQWPSNVNSCIVFGKGRRKVGESIGGVCTSIALLSTVAYVGNVNSCIVLW